MDSLRRVFRGANGCFSSLRGVSVASNEAISPFGIVNEIASSFASQKTRNDGAGRVLASSLRGVSVASNEAISPFGIVNEIASSFASQKTHNDGVGRILQNNNNIETRPNSQADSQKLT